MLKNSTSTKLNHQLTKNWPPCELTGKTDIKFYARIELVNYEFLLVPMARIFYNEVKAKSSSLP